MQLQNDEQLWMIARQRASFKKSMISYFLVNTFLVCIWFVTNGRNGGYFWPVWPIIGWGFGLAVKYFGAYHGKHFFSTEREYEALKKKEQQY